MDGTNGSNGMNGSNGNDIILSEKAKIGLDIAPVALDLAGKDGPTIEKIGQGSYWVNAVIDCSGCHSGPAGYLSGGITFPFPVPGETGDFVVSRNLTPDPATGLKLSEADFLTALQTGNDFTASGQVLIVMPWVNFRWMHTDDLKAIYAYLKAIPPVSNANMADHKGLAAQIAPVPLPDVYDRGLDIRAITPETDFMGKPLPDPDGVERGLEVNPLHDYNFSGSLGPVVQSEFGRGSYLVNAAACNDCHTNPPYNTTPGPDFLAANTDAFLSGGAVFPTPPGLESVFHAQRSMSANLIGETNGFFNEGGTDFALFREIITTGLHVDDTPVRPLAWPMPYDHFRNMTEDDLVAVYTYLYELATLEPPIGANDKVTQGAAIWCDATHACPTGAGFTCHIGSGTPNLGNECVGNTCTTDADCGACQHCTGSTTKTCTAPDNTVPTDIACASGAGI